MGIALFRAVQNLARRRKEHFFIPDIIDEIEADDRVADKTKEALLNRLEMAEDWDIFSTRYQELWETFDQKAINIVDLSTLDPGTHGRRNLVVDVLARDIFKRRTIARRKEELGLIGELPRVWMLIDERLTSSCPRAGLPWPRKLWFVGSRRAASPASRW